MQDPWRGGALTVSTESFPFPPCRFQLIYADPPWTFDTYSPRGQGKSPSQHYAVMESAAICQLPVAQLASTDSILALWVYTPRLPDALTVMASWGFNYKTAAVWDKDCFGTGYYFRSGAEFLLLGRRGKGLPRHDRAVRQVIREARREHSRKPDGMYTALERMFGDVSRIELFARRTRQGWTSWGYEA
jgi:N6-adenosine-specific RNA methylase IME4